MKTNGHLVKIIFILSQFFFSTVLFSQTPPTKQWDKRFGGNLSDEIHDIQQTSDGGYIIGGLSSSGISGDRTEDSRGNDDYWVVKIDANGLKQWDKRFGGIDEDWLYTVKQTADGGYILGGESASGISGDKTEDSRGENDYWVVKIDANGIKQWDKRFGGNGYDEFLDLQITSDGGYILWGQSPSNKGGDKTEDSIGGLDFWVVKIDANGSKQWDKTFGGDDYDAIITLEQTSDGGYILGGESSSDISGNKTDSNRGGEDFWVIKIDASGTKQWDKSFGGSGEDYFEALKKTNDGGYILWGISQSGISGDKSESNRGSSDYWVVKIDENGIKEWDKSFGGSSFDNNLGVNTSLQITSDGGYILGGNSDSGISGDKTEESRGLNDFWVVKINANGTKEWDKSLGGNMDDYIESIMQTYDGGYIIAGLSLSGISGDKTESNWGFGDYWIVKINANGTKEWDKRFGGSNSETLLSFLETNDDGYILAGGSLSGISGDKSENNRGGNDYWVVKLASSVLPVTLLNFNVSLLQNKKVLLSWNTANEINNNFFTIEKSRNSKDFLAIGTITAKNNGQNQNGYSYIDNSPFNGLAYYRLKQTDKDGKFTYSKVIPITLASISSISIKPNPSTNGNFNIDFGEIKNNIQIIITDNNGRNVYSKQLESAQTFNIYLNKPKGIYHIKANFDGGQESSKLIIE